MDDFSRLLIIYIGQLSLSIIFLSLSYKILRRNRNNLSLILSGFYISEALGFIINAIYIPLRINPFVYVLYFIALFLIIFGQIFLVLFNINILKMESSILPKKILIFLLSYAFLIFLILFLTDGITINKETNWRPVWSWTLLIILFIFTTFIIFLPFLFFYYKLYRTFEDKTLKKKLKIYFGGFLGITFAFYGGMLYNTLNDPIFSMIWSIIATFLIIISCGLIYYAWAQRL